MPNCFQLLRDGEPVSIRLVDEEMCQHFGVACHPKYYYCYWYDVIGYDLARGRSFDEIRADIRGSTWTNPDRLVQIADWLEKNFTVRHWVEIGRRP